MIPRRVVIVGGGPGGVCAAMLLAKRGFDVELIERRQHLGGRSGELRLGAYSFDVGSTMVMMPFVVEEMFESAGVHLRQEVEMVCIDPMYRLHFQERYIDMYADAARMRAELERFELGSGPGLDRFLGTEHARLEHLYPVLQRSWPNLSSMLRPEVASALPHIGLGQSLYDTAGHYFTSEELRLAFSFQAAYLGMSPWECPGGFCMVPYVEHAWGLYYVRGGIHRLSDAMANVAKRLGARVRLGTRVQHLVVESDRCVGVQLDDGTVLPADEVIINADATNALLGLLDKNVSHRFTRERIEHQEESCSTFMWYLGLDTELELPHHSFYFAEDYRAEMARVFHEGTLNDDLSLYVCNPGRTDPDVAPSGHSALYLLALVPNTRFDVDWTRETPTMRSRMLRVLNERAGIDVERHLVAESIFTPANWQRSYGVSHGAVFGPAHRIDQLLALRLPNELPHPHNVYLAGAGTSPGSGLPTILESARIAARTICQHHGVEFPASAPLPAPLTTLPGVTPS